MKLGNDQSYGFEKKKQDFQYHSKQHLPCVREMKLG